MAPRNGTSGKTAPVYFVVLSLLLTVLVATGYVAVRIVHGPSHARPDALPSSVQIAENPRLRDLTPRPSTQVSTIVSRDLPKMVSSPVSPTAEQVPEAGTLLRDLEASGTATAGLASSSWQVFADWQNHTKGAVTFTEFRCFRRGCTAKATYANVAAFMVQNVDMENSSSWRGPRFHSGPERTSGDAVQAVWILYRSEPDSAG